MATTFVKPENPGVKIDFVGEKLQRPPSSFSDVVALPIVHDWGPVVGDTDAGKLVNSFPEFEALYGTSDTEGRTAVLGAFNGIGLEGQGGAGGVIPVRMAAAAAAKATRTVQNTTPATALTLSGKYKGTRGNLLSYIVDDDPQNVANDRFRILFNGVVVETYRYAQTDINALAAAINGSSKWVTAVANLSGVALTAGSGSFTGGNDGSTLTGTEWAAALSALEFRDFGIFSPYNLVDTTVLTTILTWMQQQQVNQRPFVGVFGGAAGETLAQAITRTGFIRDTHAVSLGMGTYHDDLVNKDLSTAQLAPRLAGVLAARGDDKALTYAQLAGLHLVSGGPGSQELRPAADAGVTVLRQVSDPNADLIVSRGVTTFISPTAAQPIEVFSEPRFIRIMDNFIRTMGQWASDKVIGDLTVTDDTRAAVRSEGQGMINDLLRRQLILPANAALTPPRAAPFIDVPEVADPDLADAIPFSFGWTFARTANFVIGQGKVL